MKRGWPWILLGIAAWPTLAWYAKRMADGVGDDRCGLVALALAIGFAWAERAPDSPKVARSMPAAVAVVAYALISRAFPPLFGAAALVVTLVLLARAQGLDVARRPAWIALCALSLPILASAQFYVGYPLRLCATTIAAGVMTIAGVDVVAEGTMLIVRGTRVLIDEPCSGVKTLWTSALLASALALRARLDGKAAWWFAGLAALCAGMATIARTVVLALLESGAEPAP
ncbi:MAG: archaeosortase/exosortase family protein, partial [Planctomycetes bacterium]|nr:archaeosortase/exosortase family protein [Planctomycetota bacterium]